MRLSTFCDPLPPLTRRYLISENVDISGWPLKRKNTLYRRKRPYGFIIEKNNNMGSKTVPMGSKVCCAEPTLSIFNG